MWNKTNEAKPSSPAPELPASAPIIPAPVSELLASPPAGHVASRISSGLRIHGEVSGDSDLYIDGEVQGKIRLTNSRLTVGASGRVQADADAREIVIEGSMQGNMKASVSVRLGQSSRVLGSILTPRLAIDDGAQLRGKVETILAAQPKQSSIPGDTSDSENLRPVSAGDGRTSNV
jgi:cytoskeletal protein CcmA (bactofilin family)